MFETFPFLLGAILNYQEYFSLISMLIFFAFAILFYILYYIFKCLEDYFIMQKILYEIHKDGHNEDNSQPFLPDSVISNEKFKLNGRYIENSKKNLKMNSQQEFFSNYSYQKSKLVKTLFWIAYFWGLVCWICLSFTPICWSAFGKLSIPVTIFILLFLYYVRFFSDVMDFRPKNMKLLKNRDNENFFLFNLKWFARINIVTCRRYKFFYIGANVLIIFSSIFLPFLFQNSCITFHNPSIGFLLGETDFSTKLTRQSLSERCPEGAPCHIYVTLPENATNSVFLNFHTNQKHENTEVLYDEYDYYHEHKTLRNRVKVKRFDPELEPTGSRYVYSSLITDLKAKNSYAFGIFYDNTYQSIKIYNTLPNFITDNDTVVFVNGGDVGSSASVQALTNSLITQLPNVLFIGGNIAYDNGLNSCYHTWDNFLSMMDTLSLSLNRLVPVVLAVGNHDVGLNSLSKINISTSNSDAPLYFQYFPQHYQRDHQTGAILSEVPEIEERKTYFAHMFAGTVFYTLDSGYINTFQGYQSKWLNDSLSENNNLIKFVHYHASSFPSCKFENNLEKTVNVQSLMYWNSLFDKYNVTAVYENYFHLLKRTWKLKGNTENINGTIYLGDGGWGDIDEQCTMNDDKFYVNVSRKQHVWVSKISAKIINFTAIGINGIVHDQHSQKI